MKIAIRGGHNYQTQGSIGIVNEVEIDRKIYPKVIEYLKQAGHEVIDVTPGNMDLTSDLVYGVKKANNAKVDLFISIHLNAGGGKGSEALYHSNSSKGKEIATRIANNLASLGFVNRGAKADVRGLYEINHTTMTAIIIECFFVDSQTDVDIYNKVGIDNIAKVIAEGIIGQKIDEIKKEKVKKNFDTMILDSKNSVNIVINGKKVNIENYIIEDRTFVSIRDVCNLFGKEITWDNATRTIVIK